MGSRFERAADPKLNEKHQKILKEFASLAENKTCADCRRKDPRWCSINLGYLVCLRCSGVHRSLGVHITKMRSIDLDTFAPEAVMAVLKWGNFKANSYWEANYPPGSIPSENAIDSFIRAKYERKQYVASSSLPDPDTLSNPDGTKGIPPLASLAAIGANNQAKMLSQPKSGNAVLPSKTIPAQSNASFADFQGFESVSFPSSASTTATPLKSIQNTSSTLNPNSLFNIDSSKSQKAEMPSLMDDKEKIMSLYSQNSSQTFGTTKPSILPTSSSQTNVQASLPMQNSSFQHQFSFDQNFQDLHLAMGQSKANKNDSMTFGSNIKPSPTSSTTPSDRSQSIFTDTNHTMLSAPPQMLPQNSAQQNISSQKQQFFTNLNPGSETPSSMQKPAFRSETLDQNVKSNCQTSFFQPTSSNTSQSATATPAHSSAGTGWAKWS